MWHALRVTLRTLFAAALAAAVGLASAGAAEAQLWKPNKKKPAATAAPAKKRPVARKKRPIKKKPAEPAVKLATTDGDSDRGDRSRDRDEEVDDRPRITVVDGDAD